MRKQKSCKPLLYLLLTGWCLLFLRCESTEKSMVRAVYLAQTEQRYQAGLLYQAPQAAADAAEASAALRFAFFSSRFTRQTASVRTSKTLTSAKRT